jgi:hypothetical protein
MGCLMVASNQGSDEGGKMHMQGVCRLICTWQHVATPSTPESAQCVTSLRAYELTSLSLRSGIRASSSDINNLLVFAHRSLAIGFTMRSNVKCVWYTPRSGNL